MGIKKNKALLQQLHLELEKEENDLVYSIGQQYWSSCRNFSIPAVKNESEEDYHRRMNSKWSYTLTLEPNPNIDLTGVVYGFPPLPTEEDNLFEIAPGGTYVELCNVETSVSSLLKFSSDFKGGKGTLDDLNNLVYEYEDRLWVQVVKKELLNGKKMYQDGTCRVRLLAPTCKPIETGQEQDSQKGGDGEQLQSEKLELQIMESGVGELSLGS